jgi:hypothetical protein
VTPSELSLEDVLDSLSQGSRLDGMRHLTDVVEADDLVKRTRELAAALCERTEVLRARVTADRVYLTDRSLRDVATELGYSPNALSLWLRQDGPRRYVTVRSESGHYHVEAVPPKALDGLKGAERRVAPSVWGLYDDDKDAVLWEGTAEDLWKRLRELT